MKIAILGGGISGLSAAFFAKKRYPDAKIVLFEASDRLGGVIDTGFLDFPYERGPRTFVASRSVELLELIDQVGLSQEIIKSPLSKRFLWEKNKLRSFSSIVFRFLPTLLKEAWKTPQIQEEESIYDFACRRLSPQFAEMLLDPMTLGIFAGDIKKLSLPSTFPFFSRWEKEGKSILRGLFFSSQTGGLFSLKKGLHSLIHAIEKKINIDIFYQSPVTQLLPHGVVVRGQFFQADQIVSALPGPVLGKLSGEWLDFPTASLWVVHVAFKKKWPRCHKGFGYLIPTQEKEALLGVVFDSALFPSDRPWPGTFLTCMVRNQGDATWVRKQVEKALDQHLQIQEPPSFWEAHFMQNAIPQFEVGYAKALKEFLFRLQRRFPRLLVTGNYLENPSVNGCVSSSKKIF